MSIATKSIKPVIPGRTPASSLGETFNALLHGLGETAAAFFPDVDTATAQGHAFLTSKTLHDHREYPETYGMEDNFGISSSTDANVCASRMHHVNEGGRGGGVAPRSAGIWC